MGFFNLSERCLDRRYLGNRGWCRAPATRVVSGDLSRGIKAGRDVGLPPVVIAVLAKIDEECTTFFASLDGIPYQLKDPLGHIWVADSIV